MTVGVRLEHFEIASDGDGAVHPTVDVVEELGADAIIHGQFGSDRTAVAVRVQGFRNPGRGTILSLRVDPGHVHVFDPESGRRLNAA